MLPSRLAAEQPLELGRGASSCIGEGGVHLALNLWLLRGLTEAFHRCMAAVGGNNIASCINNCKPLVDPLSKDGVGAFAIIGLLLQLLALGDEGVHPGELGLCVGFLEFGFLLLILDLLGGSSPDTLKQMVM